MTAEQFTSLALSLPNTIASPHFDRTAFKVTAKRIFATLHIPSDTVNLKLSPADQSLYCLVDKEAIYAVANKWGLQGWTTFKIDNMDNQLLQDALDTAYREALTTRNKSSKKT